jgi:uncharacterized membrane protein
LAAITHTFARRDPQLGVTLSPLVASLAAAIAARVAAEFFTGAGQSAAPVAYIAGTIGTLIGADILNLPALQRNAVPSSDAPCVVTMLSIGGARVVDDIFLAGICAPLLA